MKLAVALAGAKLEAEHRHIRIVILGVATVPEETPLSQGTALVKAYRTMLRYIPQNDQISPQIEILTEVRVAREVWQGILDQAKEETANLLLLHWKGYTQTPSKIYGTTIDAVMANPPCDIVLARLPSPFPAIKSILLPVRGGSHNSLALDLATNLEEEWEAATTVLHCIDSATTDKLGEPETASIPNELLPELPPNAKFITMRGKALNSITQQAVQHDMVILGASESGNLQTKFAEKVAQQIKNALLVVKNHQPFTLPQSLFGTKSATYEPSLPEAIDRWFAENTFNYREFRSMSSLTLLKEKHYQSVSLVVPVYGTVQPFALAEFVRKARFALLRDCALLDEIIVCAPLGSLSRAEFFELYDSQQIALHEDLTFVEIQSTNAADTFGPGQAVWHALQHLRGDIVVWADPLVQHFEARYLYGLVGPLLTYPEFQMSIGFYSEADEQQPEYSKPTPNDLVALSVRPLLSGFYPNLAGIIDPLCSTGAARRDLLERLPLQEGSAFSVALLTDVFRRDGLMSIAQVDLGNPPSWITQLSPQHITNEVVTFLLRRLDERNQTNYAAKFDRSIKTVVRNGEAYSMQIVAASELPRELPPLIYNKNYRRRNFIKPKPIAKDENENENEDNN